MEKDFCLHLEQLVEDSLGGGVVWTWKCLQGAGSPLVCILMTEQRIMAAYKVLQNGDFSFLATSTRGFVWGFQQAAGSCYI